MAKDTSIAWAHHTSNPWIGCSKVNADCKNCYMFRDEQGRFGRDASVVRKAKSYTWRTVIRQAKPGERVFVCSLSDFWHEGADEWRGEVFDEIRKRPDVNFLIPTKRPDNILSRLPADWGLGWPNVWIGFSGGHQAAFDKFYEAIQAVPCHILWASVEPLIEYMDVTRTTVRGVEVNPLVGSEKYRKLNWLVVGGESGNETGKFKYRECYTEWMIDIVDSCKRYGVPVFVKQMGTYLYHQLNLKERHGTDVTEFPMKLRYQQFPETVNI